MQRFLFIIIFLFLVLSGKSQCYKENTSYQSGEQIEFEVYYNWGVIWLNAGWVRFQVKDTTYNNQSCYLFDSYGSSHKSYDWLFKVRDQYISIFDKETLRSQYFYRKNYEGGYEVDNKYVFDWNKNKVFSFTQNSNKPYSIDTLQLPKCTYDLLSLIYYARNLDYSKLKVGAKVPVISIIDNEVFNLYIRYLGKESIKDREGKRHSCIKFSVLLIEGTIFKGGEDMTVWVTNDSNRVPIFVEAKIVIGSVKAYLRKSEGLRHP